MSKQQRKRSHSDEKKIYTQSLVTLQKERQLRIVYPAGIYVYAGVYYWWPNVGDNVIINNNNKNSFNGADNQQELKTSETEIIN